jgi:hypothetical protein
LRWHQPRISGPAHKAVQGAAAARVGNTATVALLFGWAVTLQPVDDVWLLDTVTWRAEIPAMSGARRTQI